MALKQELKFIQSNGNRVQSIFSDQFQIQNINTRIIYMSGGLDFINDKYRLEDFIELNEEKI